MTARPVAAAVEFIAAAHEVDLATDDPPLRSAAWEAFGADVTAFLHDLAAHAAVDLDTLVDHAYRQANASFASGGDGGPWWAFLTEYGAGVDCRRVLADAEGFLSPSPGE